VKHFCENLNSRAPFSASSQRMTAIARAGAGILCGALNDTKSELARFCDGIAAPSPTGRDAAGRLSRENNGRGIGAAAASQDKKKNRDSSLRSE
jgi:hypothetical protein